MEGSAPEAAGKKRRRRTGCLTCRTRRVKCDERKPTCDRCDAANIDCAGYEEKRHVAVRVSHRSPTDASSRPGSGVGSGAGSAPASQPGTVSSSGTSAAARMAGSPESFYGVGSIAGVMPPRNNADAPGTYGTPGLPVLRFREDGLPLVALPSNPLSSQRPHSNARQVLGYHQFLFRTLPVLFPQEHVGFWRDRLCQEAWEAEYVWLALVALGNMHRATLMASVTAGNDRNRGIDTKVIAVQSYTRALQDLSSGLEEIKQSMEVLIGALFFLAYFECFAGNIPAALGHVQVAANFYIDLQNDPGSTPLSCMPPLASCLRDFCQVWRMALPFPRLMPSPRQTTMPSSSGRYQGATGAMTMKRLVDIVCSDAELEDLIWSAVAPYKRTVTKDAVDRLCGYLREWRSSASHALPQLDSDAALESLLRFKWDRFPIPPPPYPDVPPSYCVAAAMYSFYMGRMAWALCLLGEDAEANEWTAYFYFYEAMRFAATQATTLAPDDPADAYIPCEALRVGYLPMLHIAGQCTLRPSWLRWIAAFMRDRGREGLFKGSALATSIDVLHTLELHRHGDVPAAIERFPPPASRIISTLVPETNGQSYICYYACPRSAATGAGVDDGSAYYPIANARWSGGAADEDLKPEIEIYDDEQVAVEPFTSDWLLAQAPIQEWVTWSSQIGFSLDRALRDHINGSGTLEIEMEMDK